MKFRLIPITLEIRKDKWMLSLFGFHWKNTERAIGFSLYEMKHPYFRERFLCLFFYGFIRRIKLKIIYDKYALRHRECLGAVWPHNLYCEICCETVYYEECDRILTINLDKI